MAMGMKAGMAVLGRLGRGLRRLQRGTGRFGRAMRRVSDRLHSAARRAMDRLGVPPSLQNRVNRAICSVTGHPVDIATGKVFTEMVDFELPGPIPLKWERAWYSTSSYHGPLGHGWHYNYDLGLVVDTDTNSVALRMEDGRPVAFPMIEVGQDHFDRAEKLTLFKDEAGYAVRNSDNLIFRFQVLDDTAAECKLILVEDLLGNSIKFRYDNDHRLTEIIDSGGRLLQIKNDQHGRIIAVFAPDPSISEQWFPFVRYTYDDEGNLIDVIDALGHKTRYKYKDHLLVQETNPNGLSFYFEYEGSDHTAKCIRTWGDKGIYNHRLTYLDDEALTIVENSLGHKTRHYWNSNGLVTEVIDARGGVRITEYNEFNEKLSETDPVGNVTSYEYDEFGNQIKTIKPDGATISVKYDNLRNPVEAIDTIGGKWCWEYDTAGRLLKRTNPLGETNSYHYSEKWIESITDPLGGHTSVKFDYQGNLTHLKTPDEAESRWKHDSLGRATSAIDPKGNRLFRQFDLLGRVVEVQEPDGNIRRLQYDPESNVTRYQDKQRDVKFAYSGMGRMIARTEAGTTVQFAYDTEERLIGVKNEHGFVYRFQLDENGEVEVESGFDDVRRVYTRDEAGRVTSVERASGIVTSYQHDPAGRVAAVEHSDGSAESYRYRLDGELEEAVNDTITVKLERDALGRILKEWQGDDYWVASEYNPLGKRIRISSSLGAIQTIERNIMGDATQLACTSQQSDDMQKNTHADWEARFKRDLMGLELERQLPGGVRSRWERDKLGRPIQHHVLDGNKPLRDVRYVWDVNDRLRQVIDAQKGITKYDHDALGNLTTAQYGDGVIELRMPDAVGNLFRSRERSDRKYGPAGQLLEAYSAEGTTFFKYDAEGNLISKREPDGGKWEYHWNASGMLVQVVRPDQKVVRFTYDALARRTIKEFQGKTTRWIWDGNKPLHEWFEYAGFDGGKTINNSASNEKEIAAITRRTNLSSISPHGPPKDGTKEQPITWVFDPDTFAPAAKMVGDKVFSIITDHLGTPTLMLDASGTEMWSADISVWGKLRNQKGEKYHCPFRYPGQYEDEETGLCYNRYRYYDPDAGQYVSANPIGLLGKNPEPVYAYVADPLVFLKTCLVWIPRRMHGNCVRGWLVKIWRSQIIRIALTMWLHPMTIA